MKSFRPILKGMFCRDPLRPMLATACLLGIVAVAEGADIAAFKLSSTAFQDQGSMDRRFTCQGGDHSPPLAWSGAPAGTKSYALIMDDPDAPAGTWVHWVLYDIPASTNGLPQDGATALPAATRKGTNSWDKTGYGGPCPPSGRHRYFHKLYALDAVLPDLKQPTKDALETAMKGHVLAEAVLMGTYQKG